MNIIHKIGPNVSIWGFGTLLKGTSAVLRRCPPSNRAPPEFCPSIMYEPIIRP